MVIRSIMLMAIALSTFGQAGSAFADEPPVRVMEALGRGVVALNRGKDVFISWRLLGTEPQDTAFNLYRITDGGEPVRLNDQPLTGGTNFVDQHVDLQRENAYVVRAIRDGKEQPPSKPFVLAKASPARQYLEVPLKHRDNTYVHLAWVGDLDGDGEYDFVVDRLPMGGEPGTTQKLEAYLRDGTFLWSVDFGPLSLNPKGARWNNPAAVISNGHNDGVTVYDLDLDGKAEVIIKSARGVIFGEGKTVQGGDDVQQYISVLDGMTGAERARAEVPRDLDADGPVAGHMGIMYLDGVHPSIVFKAKNRAKSGSFNLMSNTWSFDGQKLKHEWKWNRGSLPLADAHQVRIVDVDRDGRDELCEIGFVVDDDGKLLYGMKGIVHGDRFHIGDLDPDRPGLEGFGVQQKNHSKLHLYYYDAATGQILRKHFGKEISDIGRGIAADADPRYRGYEYWAFSGMYNAPTGKQVSGDAKTPWPNFRIWWDGDALSEILNREVIEKWDYENLSTIRLLTAYRDGAIKTWRDAPVFYGDILGDWREEVIWEHRDHDKLMIFTTTDPSDIRLYTLPHNPEYRACMTVKGYMQSNMVDYYLGDGMETPPAPRIIDTTQYAKDQSESAGQRMGTNR